MTWKPPPPAVIWQAMDIYLHLAYTGAPSPSAVRGRIETLRALPVEDFYNAAVFERTPPAEPARFALRLGSRFYPHMKLVVERAPDGHSALLRADTHDKHIACMPDAPDYTAFCELIRNNQALAAQIEAAWEEVGLPTFKHFLRDDLARRAKESPG